MDADEIKPTKVKTSAGVQELIDLAQRTVPDVRRSVETLEPVRPGRRLALLKRAREGLDWSRIPGLRVREARPARSQSATLLRRFGMFVLLPTAVVGLYLFLLASDQYIAEAQFAVRGNIEPMGEATGEYAGLIQKHNSQDSFIVRDFVQSRPMVEAAQAALDVTSMFARRDADIWERYYMRPRPIEDLVQYWNQHVQLRIEAISGIMTLSVRAFSPEDALAISREVIGRAEALINEISRRAQGDMVVQSQKEADAADARLKASRVAMQTFRNRWGIIDPVKTAESTVTTIEMLRKDKLKAENDLRVLRGSNLDEKSRGIQVLVATVGAIDGQMKQLQDRLTTAGLATTDAGSNLTQALLEYEGLKVEETVAQKLNESAHMILDRARIASGKQSIYLATFVPPALAADSLYPKRGRGLFIAFFCFFMIWSSVSLIVSGINDQRL